jgi:hypothetical protein
MKTRPPATLRKREDPEDALRPEYDLAGLQLRRVGPGRETPEGPIIRLDADVVQMFPDSRAVNEALRFLIRIAKTDPPTPG